MLIVSPDKTGAAAFAVERNASPNNDYRCIKGPGLEKNAVYHVENRVVPYSVKDLGSLINTVAPFHVKQDGIVHNIIDWIKEVESERQTETITGAAFKSRGISLNSSFSGTGYNEHTRIMRTGDTRLYMFEKI